MQTVGTQLRSIEKSISEKHNCIFYMGDVTQSPSVKIFSYLLISPWEAQNIGIRVNLAIFYPY